LRTWVLPREDEEILLGLLGTATTTSTSRFITDRMGTSLEVSRSGIRYDPVLAAKYGPKY
jgi:hypothetical protein